MFSCEFCEIFEHLFHSWSNTRTPFKSAKDKVTFEDSEQHEKLENLLKVSNYFNGQNTMQKHMIKVLSQVFCRINIKADFQISTTKTCSTIKFMISTGELCKVF